MEEDIGPRVANGKRQAQMFNERSARFSLYEDLRDTASPSTREAYIRDSEGTFLDLLMSEIPGRFYLHMLCFTVYACMNYIINNSQRSARYEYKNKDFSIILVNQRA